MILSVVRLKGRYLKSAEGYQALEWTKDVHKARHWDASASHEAYAIAEIYDADVVKHDMDTDKVIG